MFITLEGIEGSGKTTQMEAIAKFLRKNGDDVITTREPGATATGNKIRSILLDPENSTIYPLCELMLYGADRAQHIAEVILPALNDGKTILCDRFADATVAYQGFGRGIDIAIIDEIYKMVASGFKPDLTILFDLDPVIGLKRTFKALKHGERRQNESRFEQENINFHERVRQGYLAIAKKEKERFLVIDASVSREEIFKQIVYSNQLVLKGFKTS